MQAYCSAVASQASFLLFCKIFYFMLLLNFNVVYFYIFLSYKFKYFSIILLLIDELNDFFPCKCEKRELVGGGGGKGREFTSKEFKDKFKYFFSCIKICCNIFFVFINPDRKQLKLKLSLFFSMH